jgi:hypothetical protein
VACMQRSCCSSAGSIGVKTMHTLCVTHIKCESYAMREGPVCGTIAYPQSNACAAEHTQMDAFYLTTRPA